jgi:hypothetical protein
MAMQNRLGQGKVERRSGQVEADRLVRWIAGSILNSGGPPLKSIGLPTSHSRALAELANVSTARLINRRSNGALARLGQVTGSRN